MRDSKNTHSSYYGSYGNTHLLVLYIHSYLAYENGLVCITNGMCWLYVPNVQYSTVRTHLVCLTSPSD